MHQLTLLRHGQSQWNLENRFTGWTDVDLSAHGISEAKRAGVLLRDDRFVFDRVYTSVLKRAIHTAWIVMDEIDQAWLPVVKDWRINERHYGALQGRNKRETALEYGEDQVRRWRRGYRSRPPAITEEDIRNPANDSRYASLSRDSIPLTESLKEVLKRTVYYWENTIAPQLLNGDRVLIVAHGNTLRALVMYFDGMSEKEVTELSIPTGIPLVYELDDNIRALGRRYLGDPEVATQATLAVAEQSRLDLTEEHFLHGHRTLNSDKSSS